MTPTEFLALTRQPTREPEAATPSARAYAALETGATEAFLTLHTTAGRAEALGYGGLHTVSADERTGTGIKLHFARVLVQLQGRQLWPVFEALRARKAAHLHQFDPGRHDPPEPGVPVILEIGFAAEAARATAPKAS